jgi:nitrogen fixation protein NifU and related proteins
MENNKEMNDTDFWNCHSVEYLEMAFESGHKEALHHPDGYGKRTGDCGDTVEFYIRVRAGRLDQVSFTTHGCLNTTACCNTVVKLTRGKTIDQAWEITPDDVVNYLQTLPKDHEHCAQLAVGGLYLALSDFQAGAHKQGKTA